MGKSTPTADDVIDALVRLGFEKSETNESKVILVRSDDTITIPKGSDFESQRDEVKKIMRQVFTGYERIPFAKPIERIRQWANNTT